MKLLEYEAKDILERYRIAVPSRRVVQKAEVIPFVPAVLKSQVHTGGRGKAGGVRIAADEDAAESIANELFSLPIGGELPGSLLIEEVLEIEHELYISISINRETTSIELLAAENGGIDVEDTDKNAFLSLKLSKETISDSARTLSEHYRLTDNEDALQRFIQQLYVCFTEQDALLIEINPLVITKQRRLVAADCKMELDDAAVFRHDDWKFAAQPADANFVVLNNTGSVATIANGAGLAMATVDAVTQAGLTPANFLDIGGSATKDSIIASFQKILLNKQVSHILINIFGGIVQCDIVARATIEAKRTFPSLPELVIRLSGNRADIARDILEKDNIVLHDDLASALEAIR